jgi:hypothetical protein
MNTRFILLLLAVICIPAALSAQPYEHAGGIRAGYSSGLSYKGFFLHRMSAIEIDALYNQHGLNLAGMFVMHVEPFRNSRWLLYFGGGLFGGNWDQELSAGVAAIGGMEYTLRDLPLNIGLDWRPMGNLYKEGSYDLLDFGLTIRYRFTL